eukprot:COSAG05_NODE_1751_length_4143_cov_2.852621_2_plen_64_part_00
MFWALGDIGRAGDLIFSAYKLSKQHAKSINNGAALTRSLVCTANCCCCGPRTRAKLSCLSAWS